ncbi:MAG TPA: hypothetical protein VJH68_05185 [Candidatus Nanoarchaeia archaeon]|nr:hypothetical protein [Candidatus Nanoarchaeia archaeon]
MISLRLELGSSSASARPSMLFPVPGLPINKTCLLCRAAFLIILTASSCPITWSINFSGILMSLVDFMAMTVVYFRPAI